MNLIFPILITILVGSLPHPGRAGAEKSKGRVQSADSGTEARPAAETLDIGKINCKTFEPKNLVGFQLPRLPAPGEAGGKNPSKSLSFGATIAGRTKFAINSMRICDRHFVALSEINKPYRVTDVIETPGIQNVGPCECRLKTVDGTDEFIFRLAWVSGSDQEEFWNVVKLWDVDPHTQKFVPLPASKYECRNEGSGVD